MGMPGMGELILIFLVVLLVFGAKRIPEIARGLGQGIRDFKDTTSDIKRELSFDDLGNQQIRRSKPPRQGTSTPRGQAVEQEPMPQEPARAGSPRGVDAEKQQTS